MNCPKCGSKLDTGYNCTKCDYRYISNPQKEDIDSSEAFQIINDLAEQYGKEEQ